MNKTILSPENHKPLAFFGINLNESIESVREWVKWCANQGMGGFNIIIGSDCDGLASENPQWLAKLLDYYEVAIEEAKKHNLEVWIFDDFGYPSGCAGGQVCCDNSLRSKQLLLSSDLRIPERSTISLTLPENFISAEIIYDDGTTKSLQGKPEEIVTYTAGEKEERLMVFSWDYDKSRAKSNCKSPGNPALSNIDMLKPEAAKRFTEVMHEMYYKRFKNYFGATIKGFFYDEPMLAFEFPWTESFPEEFKARKGYDFTEKLSQFYTAVYKGFGKDVQLVQDYYDVWTDLVAENYYGVMSKWCKEHGVELTGHADLDHHLHTLNTLSGNFFKNMKYNNRPAIDVIWAQIEPGTYTDFPRYAGSVKRILGKEQSVSETFAGMGCALHPDYMRYITDHQVIRGINQFHLMYSQNSMNPKSSDGSFNSPSHMLSKPFGKNTYDRMAIASAAACFGNATGGTAIFVPEYDLYQGRLAMRNIGFDNAVNPIWEWVEDISKYLNYMPCDFDYIWADAINSLTLTENGFITGSGYVIHTIILPPSSTIKPECASKLKKFVDMGGKLISVFRPSKETADYSLLISNIWELSKYITPSVVIESKKDKAKISASVRCDNGVYMYMLLNETLEKALVSLDFGATGELYSMSLTDMSLSPVCNKLETAFEGAEMKIFVLNTTEKELPFALQPISIDKERTVQPVNWTLTLPNSSTVKLEDNQNWKDWCELGYPTYSGKLSYKAEFTWEEDSRAIISAPDLFYVAEVFIDGEPVGKLCFKPYELIVNNITKGKHNIELLVYNTAANEVCGTLEAEREKYSVRFANLAAFDKKRLKSGLLSAVSIAPVK